MGKTSIEWTDRSWSPLRVRVHKDAAEIAIQKGYKSLVQIGFKMAGRFGPHCEKVSEECDNCYSATNNRRCLPANGTGLPFDRRARDLVDPILDEKILAQPLSWRSPYKVFPMNQSDLFGEWWPDWFIDKVFAMMASTPQHTYQVLTKRPQRMREYLEDRTRTNGIDVRIYKYMVNRNVPKWPLPNVWLGVSAGTRKAWDERVPILWSTPAAIRFVSYEPALADLKGPVIAGIDWIIAGYESGTGARHANEEWIRSIKDQCVAAGVAFFYKQKVEGRKVISTPELDGQKWVQFPEVK